MHEGRNQRASSVPPLNDTIYDGQENKFKGRATIRPKVTFLDLGQSRAKSEGIEPQVARFESKWFKDLKKVKIEVESEDPSISHKPPRDSTADTYVPPPLPPAPVPSKENRTPSFHYNSKMVKIVTL